MIKQQVHVIICNSAYSYLYLLGTRKDKIACKLCWLPRHRLVVSLQSSYAASVPEKCRLIVLDVRKEFKEIGYDKL